MKIPRDLPQFDDGKTCIIIAGRQDAILYTAENGVISRLLNFKIPRPHYSDREGEFKTRGRGITISSGAVKELKKHDIIRDFIREFKQRIKRVPECVRIYIFAPADTKKKIVPALPKAWQKKVEKVIAGNYYYLHPLRVISKIS